MQCNDRNPLLFDFNQLLIDSVNINFISQEVKKYIIIFATISGDIPSNTKFLYRENVLFKWLCKQADAFLLVGLTQENIYG